MATEQYSKEQFTISQYEIELNLNSAIMLGRDLRNYPDVADPFADTLFLIKAAVLHSCLVSFFIIIISKSGSGK